MADVAIAVTTLTATTVSADLIVTAEGGTNVPTGDVAVISCNGEARNLVISFYGSGAATATFQAGDNPPSQTAGLGASSALTIPTGDLLICTVPGSRFVQDNGTIRITIGTNAVVVGAHRIPDTV